MTKKFTEKQYQKILETVNKYPNFGKQYVVPNGGIGEFSTTHDELIEEIFGSIYKSENHPLKVEYMLSLANPLTREWAYNKFVEKEKKYLWKLKSKHEIYQYLTESEMCEEGYNPEMFDKREV